MQVTASHLSKRFHSGGETLTVFDGVSFDLTSGTATALTGESGSGKSTLLHICAGLERPDGGTVNVGEADLTNLPDRRAAAFRRAHVGLVFQQFNLIPSLNVADNLTFQARLNGGVDSDWRDYLIDRLGLSGMVARYPEQLSGGQQQRVAIGRALATRPAVVFADEPTGNLDEATADTVMQVFLDLVAQSGTTLLMVTHSERLAGMLPHRLHLSGGRLAK